MIGMCVPVCFSLRADGGRGLEAVHLGHLHVHQHEVEVLRLQRGDRLSAVVGDDDRMSVLLQQADGQLLIDQAVLGQQNAAAGEAGSTARRRLCRRLRPRGP